MGTIGGILKFIWGMFGSTLVQLILSSGLPAAATFLQSKGLPTWIVNGLMAFAKAMLGELPVIAQQAHLDIKAVKADETLSGAEKKRQIKAIKSNMRREAARKCSGVGCATETKPSN